MKKKLIGVLSTVSALPIVLADCAFNKTGANYHHGFKGGHWMIGWGLLKFACLLVSVFLVSLIFWWTYRWIVVDKGLTKKKGKKK
jgi:hypothetical protein